METKRNKKMKHTNYSNCCYYKQHTIVTVSNNVRVSVRAWSLNCTTTRQEYSC
eukprot:m.33024 g.33024  ORF g.33024 m.33024 type:complete len:53 (-) comp9831_c0_seq2:556-714(-)